MAQQLMDFTGRTIIVTGAAGGGIGTATARMLAEAGATVIAAGRTRGKFDENIAPLITGGLSIVPVIADVGTDEGVAQVMEAALAAPGTLYGLANVAGGAAPQTWMRAERVTRADWRALFEQNLETMFFMSQAVARELRARSLPGAIVGVSSISGMNSAPYHIAYGTAKAAVVGDAHAGDGTRAGPYPGEHGGPRHHDHAGFGRLYRRGCRTRPRGHRHGPARPTGRAGRCHRLPPVRPVELHHRPDDIGGRWPQPQMDPSGRGQHFALPQE